MTAVATETRASAPPRITELRGTFSDWFTLTHRNLLVWARVPAYIVFTVVQPVMFVLMFRYVFGGAIQTANQGGYVNFLLPGIIGQTAAFAAISTAIALAIEVQRGILDRFRSMPIARSAVLAGRLIADSARMTLTIVIIVGVGYAVGFRFQNGFVPAVGMVLMAVLLGLTICCVSAFIGLTIKDQESVQAFGFIWIFPLTFLSSAFVPVESMPGWLQAFANNQPITHVINTLRSLALGGPITRELTLSLVWLAAVVAVFAPLAVRAYKRAS